MADRLQALAGAVESTANAGGQAVDQAGSVGRAARSPQDRTSARKLVLVSTALLLAINVYRAKNPEQGGLYRRLWGTGVVAVMLAVAADFAPEIAGPFALLLALGAFTSGGDQFLQNLLGKVSQGVPAGVNVNPATNPRAAGPPAPATPPVDGEPAPAALDPRREMWQGFTVGLALIVLNPAAIVTWVVLMGPLIPKASYPDGIVCALGVFCGSFGWFSLVAYLTHRGKHVLGDKAAWIPRVIGIGLMLYAVYLLAKAVKFVVA